MFISKNKKFREDYRLVDSFKNKLKYEKYDNLSWEGHVGSERVHRLHVRSGISYQKWFLLIEISLISLFSITLVSFLGEKHVWYIVNFYIMVAAKKWNWNHCAGVQVPQKLKLKVVKFVGCNISWKLRNDGYLLYILTLSLWLC